MREWRGRTGEVSGKSGQEHVCKDAGVQAAEVGRALGSTCPHPRQRGRRQVNEEPAEYVAQLPAIGRAGRGRWPPERLECERPIFAVG